MGVFEEMIVSVKTAIDAVGKKTGDLVGVSKLKYNEAEIKVQLKKQFEKLGQKVYESKNNENISDDYIENCIKKIDALKNQLEEIKKEICKSENKCKCCNCGMSNTKDSCYCCKCGEKLQ